MDRKAFLAWLSEVDKLSEAQKVEVGEVLAGRPTGEASVAAVEMGKSGKKSGGQIGHRGDTLRQTSTLILCSDQFWSEFAIARATRSQSPFEVEK